MVRAGSNLRQTINLYPVPACHVTGVQLTDRTPCARSILAAAAVMSCFAACPPIQNRPAGCAVACCSTPHTHMRPTAVRAGNQRTELHIFTGRATPGTIVRASHVRQRRAGFETGLGGWVGLGLAAWAETTRSRMSPAAKRNEARARSPRTRSKTNERHSVRQLRPEFKICAGSHAHARVWAGAGRCSRDHGRRRHVERRGGGVTAGGWLARRACILSGLRRRDGGSCSRGGGARVIANIGVSGRRVPAGLASQGGLRLGSSVTVAGCSFSSTVARRDALNECAIAGSTVRCLA
jgi:hypothetical protein